MLSETKAATLIFISMFYFGSTGVLIRFINMNHYTLFFIFCLTLIPISLTYTLIKKQQFKLKQHWMHYLFLGLAFSANVLGIYGAITHTTLANMIFLHYTAPIFIVIIAPFLLKEKLVKHAVPAIILATIGTILIVDPRNLDFSSQHTIGILFGLVTGLGYAFHVMMFRKMKDIKEGPLILVPAIIGAIITIPLIQPIQNPNIPLTVGYAIASSSALLLYGFCLKFVRAQIAGIIGYTELIITILSAAIILSEIPNAYSIGGGLLIIVGGLLVKKQLQ